VLIEALCRKAPELKDVKVAHLHCEGPHPHLAPEMEGHLFHRALFIGPNARAAINEGRAEFVPVMLSDVPLLMESGLLPLDAVFANMTPPDDHGFCSLGTSVEAMQTAIRCAKTVIAQFNKAMPRTHGDSYVHVSQIDRAVEVDQAPYVYAPGEIGDVERRIGEFVADLIPDEATLQMGIGAIPTAVGVWLEGKKHLGVHTEMFSDGLVDLFEMGVVTN
jgi:4-hydroxybutyrate CoA-transferase